MKKKILKNINQIIKTTDFMKKILLTNKRILKNHKIKQ